ncbi:Sbal_3080 family lipoprotein [Cupriavidus pampae]|uniref:Uncharacterized protein n=1 Tax=Cupriavidus pampae TaxID=659251 RepID=A0ABN7YPN2_9BURK|nr:Sbal_3080 family lipoprotein [Cupriavidus pampae]CAG9175373.1 hypothetical protein LMG32289_03300 [Cupriavidus pampae]
MKRALLVTALTLMVSACSTYVAVTPVDRPDQSDPLRAFQTPNGVPQYRIDGSRVIGADGTLVCVIANTVNGNAYLSAFRSSLRARNFEVKMLPPDSSIASCPITVSYAVQEQTYWLPFVNAADITVYRNGERVGKAVYNANRSAGGLNFSHLVPADQTIEMLVEKLFPGLKPQPAPQADSAQPTAEPGPAA